MNKQQIPAYIAIALVAYFIGGFLNPRVIEVPKETVKTVVTSSADWKSLKDVDDQLIANASNVGFICKADMLAATTQNTNAMSVNEEALQRANAQATDLLSQRQGVLLKLGYKN